MSKIIVKGNGAHRQLIAEVESLFVLTPEIRRHVEVSASFATMTGGEDWTHEKFYIESHLGKAKLIEQPQVNENWTGENGMQDGGYAEAHGLGIRWQKGESFPYNGCYLRTALLATRQRIQYLQGHGYDDIDTDERGNIVDAINGITQALAALDMVVRRRFMQGKQEGI